MVLYVAQYAISFDAKTVTKHRQSTAATRHHFAITANAICYGRVA